MQAQDIIEIIEGFAPLALAAEWDNSGWQVGSGQTEASGVLVALDATLEVVAEAVEEGLNLIVTHHPLLLAPLKRLDTASYQGRLIKELVAHDLNLYAVHTNLDVVPDGVSHALAAALGLDEIRTLAPLSDASYKFRVFVPENYVNEVRLALGEAGAGQIGHYSCCAWHTAGVGHFRAEEGASPHIPLSSGETTTPVAEHLLETVVDKDRLPAVLDALSATHPYQEVLYDLIPLTNHLGRLGWGALGCAHLTTAEMAHKARTALDTPHVRLTPGGSEQHCLVAVCGGSGANLIAAARRSGASLYLTGEIKYHQAQAAAQMGLTVIEVGHFYSERPILSCLAELILEKADIPVRLSEAITSPFARLPGVEEVQNNEQSSNALQATSGRTGIRREQ